MLNIQMIILFVLLKYFYGNIYFCEFFFYKPINYLEKINFMRILYMHVNLIYITYS
jgi:hypothetical protein